VVPTYTQLVPSNSNRLAIALSLYLATDSTPYLLKDVKHHVRNLLVVFDCNLPKLKNNNNDNTCQSTSIL